MAVKHGNKQKHTYKGEKVIEKKNARDNTKEQKEVNIDQKISQEKKYRRIEEERYIYKKKRR